jgi:hypothetical protein
MRRADDLASGDVGAMTRGETRAALSTPGSSPSQSSATPAALMSLLLFHA